MQGKFSGFGVCLRQQVTANKNPKRSLYTHAKVHIFLSLIINEQGFNLAIDRAVVIVCTTHHFLPHHEVVQANCSDGSFTVGPTKCPGRLADKPWLKVL